MTEKNLDILIIKLIESQEQNQDRRTLEEYLLTLWFLASKHKKFDSLQKEQFLEILKLAFINEVPSFQNKWRSTTFNKYSDRENSFLAFEVTILQQIVDLREMDEANLLTHELRYFGLDSPRGNSWYNFNPLTYLKCAVAGSFDNWEEEDSISQYNPRISVETISWQAITDFLYCGQIYE